MTTKDLAVQMLNNEISVTFLCTPQYIQLYTNHFDTANKSCLFLF